METPVLDLEVAVFWHLRMVDLFYMLSGSKTLLPAGIRHLAKVVLPLKCPFTLTFLPQNLTTCLYEVLQVLFLSHNQRAILSFLYLVTQLGAATGAALPTSKEIHRGACFRLFGKLMLVRTLLANMAGHQRNQGSLQLRLPGSKLS